MEPVGLAVSVVGLAGLFSTCIDCFHLRLRLLAWGRAFGFIDGDGSDAQTDRWSEEVRSAVPETLHRIAALLQDHRTLSRRYGLSRAGPATLTPGFSFGQFGIAHVIRPEAICHPIGSSVGNRDKQKFGKLFIQAEVESICDVSELEIVEQAWIGGRNPAADTAGLRLSQLQRVGNSSSTRPVETAGSAVGTSASTGFYDWELIPEAADLIYCPTEALSPSPPQGLM
ncbi:hypothetical protein DL766_007325 [Monosporascus sp. MC13-8B]|uniref:Prion-inhibition and propagation HeLo domain-containing protein n=1 Tax=Monosporascus cannonballus TaxID=155416 RepID=A0ABY0GRZ4_9PEZI|nr:hypothetical protein DL762_010165 [Monosporascus cannonballus]RYO76661.1 hypothetical protein DL763_010286 [Monosporascus cannonballus]RYP24253.1 hypothetical protein DL766_007325 [Monosporascus sp. MC13-8B]